jgi:outer membrane receptor protein involved in Fe transport
MLTRYSGSIALFLGCMLTLSAYAQEPTQRPVEPPAQGQVLVRVLNGLDEPLQGTIVEGGGASAAVDVQGVAMLTVPAGTHTVLVRVLKTTLPAVPTNEPEWRVSIPDVVVDPNATTEVDVGLSDTGAFIRLEVRAPEEPVQNLQAAHEAAKQTDGTGYIQGAVNAAADDTPVSDARVYVRGAPLETLSDGSGRFRLEVPAGTHQIWVIHPDFSTQSLAKLEVKAGSTTPASVKLSPRSPNDEYLITAPHIEGGIATMIAERREATAVADVIGSEQMARSGASSAASALSRVTGLTIVDGKYVIVRGMGERYSSLLVNRLQVPSPDPARRVVPLDLFPAGILEGVTVQKTYTPDMPGEFGGGVVQLKTRTYPDKFMLNFALGAGGNTQSTFRRRLSYEGGATDFLGFDDGDRALPGILEDPRGKILLKGVRGNGYSAEEIETFGRSLPNNWATKKSRTPFDLNISASLGNKYRLRIADLGYVLALGYKNESTNTKAIQRTATAPDASGNSRVLNDYRLNRYAQQVSLNGFFDWGVEFSKLHKLKFTSMVLRQTDGDTVYRTGFDEGLSVNTRDTRLGWIERQVVSQQAQGNHTFHRLADFQVDWRYAFSHAVRDEPDRRSYTYTETERGDYVMATAGGNERLFAKGTDASHEGQLDLTQPFGLWRGLKGKAKAGGLAFSRTRDASVRRFSYDVSLPAFPELRTQNPETIFDLAGPAPAAFREITNSSDSYEASMLLFGGYAMAELPLHKRFDLVAGARLEKANIKVDTFDQFNAGDPIRASLDNLDVLPALNLTYRMPRDFQLRGGYSRTLNRPDFRELSESQYFDIEYNAAFSGNSKLKRARIDNLDARLEWYYTTDEVFSIGAFTKLFDQPIESVQRPSAATLFSFENAKSAYSYGLELEGRKRFDFISKRLDPLFFAANLTLIRSRVKIASAEGGDGTALTSENRPLAAQSPYVLNLQTGWDDSGEGGTGMAASLLYNVYGRRLRSVATAGTGQDNLYERPFHSLDFVLSQTLRRGFKLGLRVRNILNSKVVWEQGDIVVRSFQRGADGQVNVSWSY